MTMGYNLGLGVSILNFVKQVRSYSVAAVQVQEAGRTPVNLRLSY